MIASAVTLSTINDLFEDPEGEAADDEEQYRGVAGWLLFVGIAGLITQVIVIILRGLYYGEIIKAQFVAFAIVVSLIHSIVSRVTFLRGYKDYSKFVSELFSTYSDNLNTPHVVHMCRFNYVLASIMT